MEPTLDQALARLFNTNAATAQPTPTTLQATTGVSPTEFAQLAAQAQQQFQRAQEALRTGDFARYGEEQQALSDTLTRLVQLSNANP